MSSIICNLIIFFEGKFCPQNHLNPDNLFDSIPEGGNAINCNESIFEMIIN